MKARLIDTHLMVPRSRQNIKVTFSKKKNKKAMAEAFVFHKHNLSCSLKGLKQKMGAYILFLYINIYLCQGSIAWSVAYRTGGHWFDSWLSQYSLWGLMMVIATGFIPLSLLSIVLKIFMWDSSQNEKKNRKS